MKAAIERARSVAEAVCHARDLINEPAAVDDADAPGRRGAGDRQEAHGLTVKVLGPKECEKLGMGMFLAVGQGSDQEPRFIHLTYTPAKKAEAARSPSSARASRSTPAATRSSRRRRWRT